MTCYRDQHGDRVLRGQHLDNCHGAGPDWHPPLTWHDCDGCEPCPEPHCQRCTRGHLDQHHPQTCPACIGRTRRDLNRLLDLAVIADQRLADYWPAASPGTSTGRSAEPALPGGDLLALTGPGSRAVNNPDRDLDERHGDPESIAAELAFYEDDWRSTRHPDSDYTRTLQPHLAGVIAYLGEHLHWAAQNYEPYSEFVAVVTDLLRLLEAELRDDAHIVRGAPCLHCATPLERRARRPQPCRHRNLPERRTERDHLGYPPELDYFVDRPEPWPAYDARVTAWFIDHLACDQGGLPENWTCPRCHRTYSPQQYRNAVAAGSRVFALPAVDLAAQYGLKPSTIRKAAQRGHITKRGTDHLGRRLYDVDDTKRYATRGFVA